MQSAVMCIIEVPWREMVSDIFVHVWDIIRNGRYTIWQMTVHKHISEMHCIFLKHHRQRIRECSRYIKTKEEEIDWTLSAEKKYCSMWIIHYLHPLQHGKNCRYCVMRQSSTRRLQCVCRRTELSRSKITFAGVWQFVRLSDFRMAITQRRSKRWKQKKYWIVVPMRWIWSSIWAGSKKKDFMMSRQRFIH